MAKPKDDATTAAIEQVRVDLERDVFPGDPTSAENYIRLLGTTAGLFGKYLGRDATRP